MSSLLLSLSSKPSLRKLALVTFCVYSLCFLLHSCVNFMYTIPQRCHTFRMFSSSTTNPYLMYCVTYSGEAPQAGAMTELRMFDPAKEDYFTVSDKPFPKELVNSRLVGSSHGWGVFIKSRTSILISDYCNPSSSKSNPKIIPLTTRRHAYACQTELVSGVAMSSPPEEDDFVMAVKFMGRLVAIYRFSLHTNDNLIFTTSELFDYFEQANIMYSKRDQRFHMPSSGGHHLWSWNGINRNEPQHHDLRFHNLPQFSPSELQLLRSCYRTQQLVESPSSGRRFLIKWYVQTLGRYLQTPMQTSIELILGGTKRFMVFREEEDMNMCYTEDIGDLCIFLGNNEPFCVKASSFPGLNPNSIYFASDRYGEGYGVYDIATNTPRSFNPKSFSAFSDLANGQGYVVPDWLPHWIPPSPL